MRASKPRLYEGDQPFEAASSPSEAATFELIDGTGVKSDRSDSDRRVFFEKNPAAALHILSVRHRS